MKNQFKFSLVILLFFFVGSLLSQEKFNAKNQQQKTVILKFSSKQTSVLDKVQNKTSEKGKIHFSKQDGYVKTGIIDIDKCNKNLNVKSMKRVFRPAGKFEEKHRKFGLHLWYEVQFDADVKIDNVIQDYQNISSIEIAEAVYDVQFADGYSKNTQTIIVKNDKTNHIESKKLNTPPNDPRYNEQWHYHNIGQAPDAVISQDINLEEAWKIETGNPQVIVAIEDEGFDINHPDLKGNIWVNSGEIPGNNIDDDNNGFVDDIHGYNFADDTGTIPAGRHGTHVAGTVAAETNNGIGVAGIAGGSGNDDGIRLMSNVIFGKRKKGGYAESLIYAADNGAIISQNSWIYTPGISSIPEATKIAIDYFIATAGGEDAPINGGTVIFAAGNEYTNAIIYPAGYSPVLSVASLGNSGKKASYSSYGKWVDISAPGGDIPTSGNTAGILSTLPDSNYGFNNGTSMACPHASGVAALVASKYAGKLSGLDLRHLLENSTDSVDHLNPSYSGQLGSGRINALKALQSGDANVNTPSNIVVSDIGAHIATVSWSSVNHASRYLFRYREQGGQWDEQIVNDTHIKLYNLIRTTTYEIQVRSESLFNVSEFSSIQEFTTLFLGIPQNISISSITGSSAEITWKPVDDADLYIVRFKKKEGVNWTYLTPTNALSQTIKNLISDISYELQVKASNENTSSLFSYPISFLTFDDGSAGCSGFPAWENDKTYDTPGQKVVHHRKIYRNEWWTQNEIPGTVAVWLKVGQCDPIGNVPPNIAITKPLNDQIIKQETLTPITLSANASDPDGTIDSIQFEVNGTMLPAGNNLNWLPPSYGSHAIKVTAIDNEGATATHQVQVIIKKTTDNLPPKVSITNPTDGQIIEQETLSIVTLSANLSDPDGTIVSVRFEVNGNLLSEGNNISWTPTAFGTYTIKVTATDDKGSTATQQVTITVKQKTNNQPPTVTIIQPDDGQVFEQETLSAITLSANASDPDGTIASIQFEANGTLLTQGNNISWIPTAFGDYTIKVTTTDDKGATATQQVAITVKQKDTGGDCNGIPAWDPGTIYPSTGGVKVSHKNMIYQNKWWTQNNEPGTYEPWGPWKLLRACNEAPNFIVSPNPVQNKLNIKTNAFPETDISIIISTLTGEIIKTTDFKAVNNTISYDVSELQKGVYVLKLKAKRYVQTQKIIIK